MKEILSSVDCVAISLPASYLLNTLNIQKQKANFQTFDISNIISFVRRRPKCRFRNFEIWNLWCVCLNLCWTLFFYRHFISSRSLDKTSKCPEFNLSLKFLSGWCVWSPHFLLTWQVLIQRAQSHFNIQFGVPPTVALLDTGVASRVTTQSQSFHQSR